MDEVRRRLSDVQLGMELCETILSRDTAYFDREISRIVGGLFDDANISYVRELPFSTVSIAVSQVTAEDCYVLSSRGRSISESDLDKLNQITALTARLLAVRGRIDFKFNAALKSQLMQSQILDQIHESVITMDLAGFILSWNLGAEKLFGYRAEEAIGQNILFLYDDNETNDILNYDLFTEEGGREMEVRRRKKMAKCFGRV